MQDPGQRLDRRAAGITAAVAGAAVVALALVVIPWHWVPGGHLVPFPESRFYTPSQLARADAYSRLAREIAWPGYFLTLAVILLLGLTPAGARLLRWVTGSLGWLLAVPVGAAVLVLIGRLVQLPFDLGLRALDLHYGLTHQALASWFGDWAIGVGIAVVLTAVVLLLLVALVRRFPRTWFAWAAGLAFVLTLLGSFAYPVVIEPLFNRFTPLPAGPLRTAVFHLAAKEGVHIDDVLVSNASKQTTTVNAYVSGFGDTRRVVVYDNLLTELSLPEQEAVIAHELGHAKNNDVLHGTLLGALGGVFGVAVLALLLDWRWLQRRSGAQGPADPAVLALVLALTAAGTFLSDPLQNAASRAIEARADRISIETTHRGAVFIAMQKQLAWAALQDPDPPPLSQFWWGTHPTPVQRAGMPASLRAATRSQR